MTELEFEERKKICKDLFLYYSKKIDYDENVTSIQDVIKQIDVILNMYLELIK